MELVSSFYVSNSGNKTVDVFAIDPSSESELVVFENNSDKDNLGINEIVIQRLDEFTG